MMPLRPTLVSLEVFVALSQQDWTDLNSRFNVQPPYNGRKRSNVQSNKELWIQKELSVLPYVHDVKASREGVSIYLDLKSIPRRSFHEYVGLVVDALESLCTPIDGSNDTY